jgi:hypothetical protein
MDFKEATDLLFQRVDHEKLAEVLGVSVASVRQARLRPDAAAHRSPPSGWQNAVAQLAKEQERSYRRLLDRLRDDPMSATKCIEKLTSDQ